MQIIIGWEVPLGTHQAIYGRCVFAQLSRFCFVRSFFVRLNYYIDLVSALFTETKKQHTCAARRAFKRIGTIERGKDKATAMMFPHLVATHTHTTEQGRARHNVNLVILIFGGISSLNARLTFHRFEMR